MNTVNNLMSTPGPFVIQRRIGSTTYKVGIHFNQGEEETLDKKVLRLLKNELQMAPKNAILESLQADWLSPSGDTGCERSSL